MSVQEKGTLPTQMEPESQARRGKGVQVRNHMGGYVYKVDDMMRLQRYVILGSESGCFHVMKEKLERENVQCIDRLVADGRGVEAVQVIKEISKTGRNVKQNALLYAFALLARCNDKDTKHAAYAVLSEVCRIPTHLFMFIKFCEKESIGSGSGTGWGRAHKRAVAKWYTNFANIPGGPEKLARLVTKYKNRENWSHKDVLRLSHPTCGEPVEMAFVLRFIAKGLKEAEEWYDRQRNENMTKIANLLHVIEEASVCKNADQLSGMIREHKLTWEHCASDLLRYKEVWLALLPHMPITALVRNLGRMTALGMFTVNSEEEELVVRKLRNLNVVDRVEEDAIDGGEEKPKGPGKRNLIHPFTILLGMLTYGRGRGEKGKSTWTPNQKVVDALDTAFYQAFQNVEPTNKKYFLAVDVSGSMSQPCVGSNSLTCAMAAAAMTMMTVRTEAPENVIVKGFSHELRALDLTKEDKLDVVMKKVNKIMMGATDCAKPMMHAIENRMRDIDVFAVYTDNETWFGKVHPTEALRQYRSYSGKHDAKLVVFGMCSTEFTIADPEDPNMFDVVGFDAAAPRVMADFVTGKI